MQFAYQFPERCERLVLVSTGGISREVHPILRVVSGPLGDVVLPLLRLPAARVGVRAALRVAERMQTDIGCDAPDFVRVFDALPNAEARRAFVRTLRAVVDSRGQVVTMLDRCYLAVGIPTMLVWGARDVVIPFEHARMAHEAMPGSRLETMPDAGHFPHHSDPEHFLAIVREFLATTSPASYDVSTWRALLRQGRTPALRVADERVVPSVATESGT
jgi:pimeloyl-ACP methyl ester carboxylesterase